MVDRNARTAVGGREPRPATLPLPPSAAVHDMVSLGGGASVAFDLGGVLLTGGVLTAGGEASTFRMLAARFGLEEVPTRRLWHDLLAPSEVGRIPESHVWSSLAAQVPGLDPMAIRASMIDMVMPCTAGVAALREFHRLGWHTALATNHLMSWVDEWRSRFPWFALLDEVVVSSDIGCRKPDPCFFDHLRARLADSSPWFIDDRLENIVYARQSGFRVVWARTDSDWTVDPALDSFDSDDGPPPSRAT